jgi:outer membrane protein assembly factor BamB
MMGIEMTAGRAKRSVPLILIGITLCSLNAAAIDWPQYGGAERNWIFPETGWSSQWPNDGPKKLWEASVGIGFSSFAVVDGMAYTVGYADEKDTLYAFKVDSGEVAWKQSYPAPLLDKYYEGGPGGTPTIHEGKLYIVNKVGDFFCFDAKSGNQVWMKDLKKDIGSKVPEWGFAGSAWIEGDNVILDMGKVVAFDKTSGKVVWQTEDYGAAYSSPIAFNLEGQRCIAVCPNYGLVIVDAKTGKEICKHPWETKYGVNAATPVIIGNTIFISSGYDHGCALIEVSKDKKPKVLWENTDMRNQFNTSIHWEGGIYGFDEDLFKCLDVKTGKVKWEAEDLGKGSVILVDGKLVILSESGELLTAEPSVEAFKPISRAQVLGGKCWTAPVLSGGKVFARNAAGDVVCIDVSGK